jgi:hypothetical protein
MLAAALAGGRAGVLRSFIAVIDDIVTQSWFGASAAKRRLTRSGADAACNHAALSPRIQDDAHGVVARVRIHDFEEFAFLPANCLMSVKPVEGQVGLKKRGRSPAIYCSEQQENLLADLPATSDEADDCKSCEQHRPFTGFWHSVYVERNLEPWVCACACIFMCVETQ